MPEGADPFFSVRLPSIPKNVPLPFDLYLIVSNSTVRFRKVGDVLSTRRAVELVRHGIKSFLVPREQRVAYRDTLLQIIRNDELPTAERAVLFKETAFNHVEELFSNPDVESVAHDSLGFVTELVNFISGDLQATTSLMKLTSHDYYTYNHSVHVAVYSISITKQIIGNDKPQLIMAGLGGLLHDLGKRQISLDIINKPGKLTPEEWNEMKKHPTYGMRLVEGVNNIPHDSKRMIFEHHEHLDGTGYPRGLKESQISKLSRIAAIADVFDALTTKRSYKEATTAHEALGIMQGMKEGKFDPTIFKSLDQKIEHKTDETVDEKADPCSPNFSTKKVA